MALVPSEVGVAMSEYLRRIDRSIEDLRQLLDVLADELDERTPPHSNPLPLDASLCKDSLQALDALLPKLEAARMAITRPSNQLALEELAPRLSLRTEY
jgi:hypothetical protein